MVGVVLGLGFQWWPEVNEPWEYLAFIFAYLNIIDYWIDYNPLAKKYAMKLEIDVMLHTVIIFSMFLIIFATQKTIFYFLVSFALYRVADILWIWRIKSEHKIPPSDLVFLDTWFLYDFVEAFICIGLYAAALYGNVSPLWIMVIFVCLRILTRAIESTRYKRVFYAV